MKTVCPISGTFLSLYYIHNGNFNFVNMEREFFQKCWSDWPGAGDKSRPRPSSRESACGACVAGYPANGWGLAASCQQSGKIISGFAANALLQSLRDSSPYGKATHDDLSVASLLRYGCHRLTTICASLSLLQIVFAGATHVRCHPGGGARLQACGAAAGSQFSRLKSPF